MAQAKRDTLSGPIRRMAKFYFGEVGLPSVVGAPDIYRLAHSIRERGVPVRRSEAGLLTKILWCLLQIQHDQEETEQHQALATLAAVVLSIIEDDDFFIPDGADTTTRHQLEVLAIDVHKEHEQLNMSVGASIGIYDLSLKSAADLEGIRARVPPMCLGELEPIFTKLKTHLGQGEQIFAGHTDPARREAHQERLNAAYARSAALLGRLLAVGQGADHPVLRAHIVRREHRHIEIDALGAQRINEVEQAKATKEYLAWTEADLGEELTDANKAELAQKLKAVAAETADAKESGSWFFDMD